MYVFCCITLLNQNKICIGLGCLRSYQSCLCSLLLLRKVIRFNLKFYKQTVLIFFWRNGPSRIYKGGIQELHNKVQKIYSIFCENINGDIYCKAGCHLISWIHGFDLIPINTFKISYVKQIMQNEQDIAISWCTFMNFSSCLVLRWSRSQTTCQVRFAIDFALSTVKQIFVLICR